MKIYSQKTTFVKFIANGYFILVALANLLETILNTQNYIWRDVALLSLASLPLLLNKRLVFLFYGLLMSFITFVILLSSIFMHDYTKPNILEFIASIAIHSFSFCCSLGIVYIGTYSPEKGKFKLI